MQAICIYLVINSHTQLVSPSSQALKKISTVYPYLFPCHPLGEGHRRFIQLLFTGLRINWIRFKAAMTLPIFAGFEIRFTTYSNSSALKR